MLHYFHVAYHIFSRFPKRRGYWRETAMNTSPSFYLHFLLVSSRNVAFMKFLSLSIYIHSSIIHLFLPLLFVPIGKLLLSSCTSSFMFLLDFLPWFKMRWFIDYECCRFPFFFFCFFFFSKSVVGIWVGVEYLCDGLRV